MIISASRRTDIPAFYAEWFIERIRAGFCMVPNPFNRAQVSVISLRPADVDAIVFWTRNPRPLFLHLDELDRRGYRYYFQFTVLDYPRVLEAGTPPLDAALRTFCELAERIGPERVIWRYDPVVLSPATDVPFHLARYAEIAGRLHGRTRRSVISVMDRYRKIERRLQAAAEQGVAVPAGDVTAWPGFDDLMRGLAALAATHDLEIVSCAEEIDLTPYGIAPGKCVDDELLRRLFGIQVKQRKDPSQRAACGCVVSRDIGMYDSCLFGCQYCYATSSFQAARRHHAGHDPHSPSLLGHAFPRATAT